MLPETDSSAGLTYRLQRTSNLYLLAILDVLTTTLICWGVLSVIALTSSEPLILKAYITPIIVVSLVVLLCTAAFGLYDGGRSIFSWNVLRRLSISWFVIISSIALIAMVSKTNYTYSRTWFLVSIFLSYLFSLIWRIGLDQKARLDTSHAASKLDVLAIGTGPKFNTTVDRLVDQAPYAYRSVRRWDWQGKKGPKKTSNAAQLKKIDAFISDANTQQLWLVGAQLDNNSVRDIISHFKSNLIQISYFPDFSFLPILRPELERRADLPMLSLSVKPLRSADRWLKSLMDRSFALLVLILLSPLLLLIAIGVKFSSPGPVLFRQERLTLNGRPFTMLKFRSMPISIEQNSGPVWAKKGENRATQFGSFLRRTSLDELPQFFNVLMGDMSVVGPRPERPFFVEKFQYTVPEYMQKHYVKAGITGWAQINGLRGNTSIEQRVEHDIFYIRNWSIWLDIKIIILTVFKGFITKTAY